MSFFCQSNQLGDILVHGWQGGHRRCGCSKQRTVAQQDLELPPPQALPQLQEVFHTNNISVSGLTLKIEDSDVANQFSIPPIPGVIIIPGNIAYLQKRRLNFDPQREEIQPL